MLFQDAAISSLGFPKSERRGWSPRLSSRKAFLKSWFSPRPEKARGRVRFSSPPGIRVLQGTHATAFQGVTTNTSLRGAPQMQSLCYPVGKAELWISCSLLPAEHTYTRACVCVCAHVVVVFSPSVMSDSLQPHGLQYTRLP